MHVFVTGASGFIGSAVVAELLDAGHRVTGLARSEAAAASVRAAGAEVQRGSLDDVTSLRRGAAAADGVIHTAFIHDMSDYASAAETDRGAIRTMGEVLAESNRPLVIASGAAGLVPGQVATEDAVPEPGSFGALRFASEVTALAYAERGVRVSVVRLPPSVHGKGDHGFMAQLISIARKKGVSAYPGDGSNRWAAVHRLDAAHLFRLALEAAPARLRLHGIAEQGVPVRDIAEAIGRHTQLPVRALAAVDPVDHFGFVGNVYALDIPASSARTREWLGWRPACPGLIEDLHEGHYFAA